jgi:RNA polymerase-binding protein DksA
MTHLKPEDLNAVRAALTAQHEALVKQFRQDVAESGNTHYAEVLGRASGDSSDEALAVTLGDLSAARLDHEVRQLRDIENAMRRMNDGDFGECSECGAAIPVARLIANPAAVRCVTCQEVFEKTHHGQAHGSI